MAQQLLPSPSQSDDPLTESFGCCGVIASLLFASLLVTAVVALAVVLVSGPPDRWQGLADANMHPLALITDPHQPQTVYVGTEQGQILITHNGGKDWQEAHAGLPTNTPISALTLLSDGTKILAGTSMGAYASTDGGKPGAARVQASPLTPS